MKNHLIVDSISKYVLFNYGAESINSKISQNQTSPKAKNDFASCMKTSRGSKRFHSLTVKALSPFPKFTLDQ